MRASSRSAQHEESLEARQLPNSSRYMSRSTADSNRARAGSVRLTHVPEHQVGSAIAARTATTIVAGNWPSAGKNVTQLLRAPRRNPVR